jgi:coenzyme F420-reducing hydrogenase gamma subunit
VCVECKSLGRTCVLVAHGTPCLGPITQAGCGALCPGVHRGCYGCFGPAETVNAASLLPRLRELGAGDDELRRLLQTFNVAAPAFEEASGTLVPLPAARGGAS